MLHMTVLLLAALLRVVVAAAAGADALLAGCSCEHNNNGSQSVAALRGAVVDICRSAEIDGYEGDCALAHVDASINTHRQRTCAIACYNQAQIVRFEEQQQHGAAYRLDSGGVPIVLLAHKRVLYLERALSLLAQQSDARSSVLIVSIDSLDLSVARLVEGFRALLPMPLIVIVSPYGIETQCRRLAFPRCADGGSGATTSSGIAGSAEEISLITHWFFAFATAFNRICTACSFVSYLEDDVFVSRRFCERLVDGLRAWQRSPECSRNATFAFTLATPQLLSNRNNPINGDQLLPEADLLAHSDGEWSDMHDVLPRIDGRPGCTQFNYGVVLHRRAFAELAANSKHLCATQYWDCALSGMWSGGLLEQRLFGVSNSIWAQKLGNCGSMKHQGVTLPRERACTDASVQEEYERWLRIDTALRPIAVVSAAPMFTKSSCQSTLYARNAHRRLVFGDPPPHATTVYAPPKAILCSYAARGDPLYAVPAELCVE